MDKNSHFINLLIILFSLALLSTCEKENSVALTTAPVKEITSNTAVGGGCIIRQEESRFTVYGICWGKERNPTVEDCDSLVYCDSVKTCYECKIEGLFPGTLYHVRAFAINSEGTSYGGNMTFLTSEGIMLCITLGAVMDTLISYGSFNKEHWICLEQNSPLLCGAVATNGIQANVFFEYGPTSSYGYRAEAHPTTLSSKNMKCYISKKLRIGDFFPCDSLHFRIVAINKSGTYYGGDKTFIARTKSPEFNFYNLQPPTNTFDNSAILNGIFDAPLPGTCTDFCRCPIPYRAHPLAPISVIFEYGISSGYGKSVEADQSPITGLYPQFVSAGISDLNPGQVYHYRIKTLTSCGVRWTADATFLTVPNAPVCITLGVDFTYNPRCIVLRGEVIANDVPAYVEFEYGPTDQYGQVVKAEQSPVTSGAHEKTPVTYKILYHPSFSRYHYRVKVTNTKGCVYGNDITIPVL